MDFQLCGAAWLDEPHDAVQGQGWQKRREGIAGFVRLSVAHGGRYFDVSRNARPRWRRPKAARRIDARHCGQIQQRLWCRVLPDHRTRHPETLDGLEGRPEAKNLVDIYSSLADTTAEAVVAEYAGAGWGKFKPALADLAVDKLAPISDEMKRLMADPAEIDRKLARGADRAREIATPILDRTYDIVGLLRS